MGPRSSIVASSITDPGVMIQSLPNNFMETDNKVFSTIILLPQLIQEGLLSVTSESMYTEYWLTA